MCDIEVRKIIKLASTRWLFLGQCVNRLLQQWEPLTVFFDGEVKSHMKKGYTSKPTRRLKLSPSHLTQVPNKSCSAFLKPDEKSSMSAPLRLKMLSDFQPGSTSAPARPNKKSSTQSGSVLAPVRPKKASSSQSGSVSAPVRHRDPYSALQLPSIKDPVRPKKSASSSQQPSILPLVRPNEAFSSQQPSILAPVRPKDASFSQQSPFSETVRHRDILLGTTQKPSTAQSQTGDFDLATFIFKQIEIAKTAKTKKGKMELKMNEEEKELTKPEKVFKFLKDPI